MKKTTIDDIASSYMARSTLLSKGLFALEIHIDLHASKCWYVIKKNKQVKKTCSYLKEAIKHYKEYTK